ncbi:MAG: 50S ribosomal protein L7ae [Candidatus Woesearchaeota archaeon]|nr:MAG: 50S ribosomal protein L7ae [Candidatus Woesearchaeota archaeon]
MSLLKTEIPKDLQEKAFEAIEISKKSGKLKKGSNEVTKVVEKGVAKLVVVAEDTNPIEVVMHLPALCEEKDIPLISVAKRSELGAAAGLQVPTAAVAIVQEGDAKNLIEEIKNKLKK